MIAEWRIFYDDGSTFDSLDGEPHEAPTEGFICAVGYNQMGGRYIMSSWDFYCFDKESNQWWGMNFPGLLDRLRRGVVYAYKEGRTITNSRFKEIMREAEAQPDFPKRIEMRDG